MRRTERNKAIYFPSKAAGIMLLLISVAFFVYLFLNFWMLSVKIGGDSMAPTLTEGDILFADRFYKAGRSLKRGDLVLVENTAGERFVRRVIGFPGEMLEIVNGVTYLNGCPLDESAYRVVSEADENVQMPVLTLGPDEYFLLSDDRTYPMDSRDPSIGPRDLSGIEALVRFRVAPKGRAAFFK